MLRPLLDIRFVHSVHLSSVSPKFIGSFNIHPYCRPQFCWDAPYDHCKQFIMSFSCGMSRQPERNFQLCLISQLNWAHQSHSDVLSLARAFMLIDNLNSYHLWLELYGAQVAPLVTHCQSCHLDQEVLPCTISHPTDIMAVNSAAI